MSSGRASFEMTEQEAGFFDDVLEHGSAIVGVAALIAGGYFGYLTLNIYVAAMSQPNGSTSSGLAAAFGSSLSGSYAMITGALWIGALIMFAVSAFMKLQRRLDYMEDLGRRQVNAQEEQTKYLRYIAEQSRKRAVES